MKTENRMWFDDIRQWTMLKEYKDYGFIGKRSAEDRAADWTAITRQPSESEPST